MESAPELRGKDIRRKKELLKKVLNVDVDRICERVVSQHRFRQAVERAGNVDSLSREWVRYSKLRGGIVLLLRDVRNLGLREKEA